MDKFTVEHQVFLHESYVKFTLLARVRGNSEEIFVGFELPTEILFRSVSIETTGMLMGNQNVSIGC
jgi:hypothetical protein